MSEGAHVTSLDALEAFRAALIVYLAKSRAVLEEVSDEKQRLRAWLQSDRIAHWDRECRLRQRKLQEAEQELFSAKLAGIRTESAAQLLAVERAKRSLREVEEKQMAVRRWNREFENRAEPLTKQIEQLQTFLQTDLSKAIADLGGVLTTLEAYASAGSGPAAPTASQERNDEKSSTIGTDPARSEGGPL
jgi:hypothetical protein